MRPVSTDSQDGTRPLHSPRPPRVEQGLPTHRQASMGSLKCFAADRVDRRIKGARCRVEANLPSRAGNQSPQASRKDSRSIEFPGAWAIEVWRDLLSALVNEARTVPSLGGMSSLSRPEQRGPLARTSPEESVISSGTGSRKTGNTKRPMARLPEIKRLENEWCRTRYPDSVNSTKRPANADRPSASGLG